MLGRHVVDALSEPEFNILEINRTGRAYKKSSQVLKIDFEEQSLLFDIEFIGKFEADFIINCAGATRQKIINSKNSEIFALKLNSVLPLELVKISQITGAKLINIATDCVFNGISGNYFEDSIKSPVDTYGETKLVGEMLTSQFLNIRTSFIGRHPTDKSGLLEWALSREIGSTIKGFENHLWNGITAMHFARIIKSVIVNNFYETGIIHVVPKDIVSKYELIKIILDANPGKKLSVEPIKHSIASNMSLNTLNVERNEEIWRSVGYCCVPSIKELLSDYFTEYLD